MAVLEIRQTGLPVVHDELDAVPEGQGVAGVDDEPHQAAADASQQAAHDASTARVYKPTFVSEIQIHFFLNNVTGLHKTVSKRNIFFCKQKLHLK